MNEVAFDLIRNGRPSLPVLVNSVQRPTSADGRRSSPAPSSTPPSRERYERELLRRSARRRAASAHRGRLDDAILSAAPDGTDSDLEPARSACWATRAAEWSGPPAQRRPPDRRQRRVGAIARRAARRPPVHLRPSPSTRRASGSTCRPGSTPHFGAARRAGAASRPSCEISASARRWSACSRSSWPWRATSCATRWLPSRATPS